MVNSEPQLNDDLNSNDHPDVDTLAWGDECPEDVDIHIMMLFSRKNNHQLAKWKSHLHKKITDKELVSNYE